LTKDLQVALNQAMRIATKTRIKDHVRVSDLCERTKIKSVNHMTAQAGLKMVWGALNNEDSALRGILQSDDFQPSASSRSKARGDFRLVAGSTLAQRNVPNTMMKLGNNAGTNLKTCQMKSIARREIAKIVAALPIV